MNTINISEKRLASLNALKLSKNILNTEGIIYDFNYRGNHKVLKVLFNSNGIMFANKLYTVELLNHYHKYMPNSFLIPDNLASISGTVSGFTIPYFEGFNLADILKNPKIDNKEKIYYLTKIGEVLNQLKNIRNYTELNHLYINDLHEANILINPNNKELKFIDLDSSKILNNCSFPSRYLSKNNFLIDKPHKYLYNNAEDGTGHLIANENSDLFCYNIIVLNFLYGENVIRMPLDEFYNYLNYLNDINVNKGLLDCFEKISIGCDNQNPIYYLDSLTDNQICRAKKIVYNCNKR